MSDIASLDAAGDKVILELKEERETNSKKKFKDWVDPSDDWAWWITTMANLVRF